MEGKVVEEAVKEEKKIRANYEELVRNRRETVDHETDEFLSQFGSAHGGWPMSASDKEDIDKLLKRSPTSSPLPPLINSTTSSVLSPRGELSQNLGSAASEDLSGPAHKRRRKGTEESNASSVVMSPFFAMKSSEGRIVSVSSSSSEGRDEMNRARINLGELLSSGKVQFPDDGLMSCIQIEVFEEEENAEDGDSSQDENEEENPSLKGQETR